MQKNILELAFLRIMRKKKSSLLTFLVLLLSFSFAIVSVSIVGSISETNAQYRLNTYGEWYFVIIKGLESDAEGLSGMNVIEKYGTSDNVAKVASKEGDLCLGHVDSAFEDVGRIRLDAGSLPQADNEVAMEADALNALGYDYTLGEEITLNISVPLEGGDEYEEDGGESYVIVEKTYVLCGVIHEYSSLWSVNVDAGDSILNSIIVTENAADELISEASDMIGSQEDYCVREPIQSYFICVSQENRDKARLALKEFVTASHYGTKASLTVYANNVAYPSSVQQSHDTFYVRVIAILTCVSLLCIGIMRIPSDAHSFSALRSMGMTKRQLALMQLFQSILLGLPAVLLGLPLGAVMTKLSLRLMLYSGSVPVQVAIPYDDLLTVLALWFGAIVISGAVVFLLALRVPMMGSFKMTASGSKRAKLFRSGLIFLLMCVLSVTVIYTVITAVRNEYNAKYVSSCPSYIMSKISYPGLKNNPDEAYTMSRADIDALKNIPGVSDVYGFSESFVGLTFSDREETVSLFTINPDDWEDTFDFGSQSESFANGDTVFMILPDDGEDYPVPESVTLRFYDTVSKELIIETKIEPQIMYLPENMLSRTVAFIRPYNMICSEKYTEKLLSDMPEGAVWGRFTVGEEPGHERVFVTADVNSDDLSTDIIVTKICKARNIYVSNRRQQYLAYFQENIQSLIMLYFSGGCICLIALMILFSAASLETENEKRSFAVLRCIGMSKNQVRLRVFSKALMRSVLAFAVGLAAYLIFFMHSNDVGAANALRLVLYSIGYYNSFERVATSFFAVVAVPMILLIFSKRGLGKDVDLK